MAVYHFTTHAYRGWDADHERGYTKKGEGYQPPDEDRADWYDANAKQDPVEFDEATQRELLILAHQICEEEGWCLAGAGFERKHMHLAVSWRPYIRWEEVDRRLKNLLALKLNRKHNTLGKRWFSRRHGAPRRVRDQDHLEHLFRSYLPDHRGLFWKRGMPLPNIK